MNKTLSNNYNLLLLGLFVIITSCSKNLVIQSDIENSSTRTVKTKTVKKLKFDSYGYCASVNSERVILAELENLRNNLINWDSKTVMNKEQMMSIFKDTIVNLNKFAKIDNNNIQTDEREWIWSELEKMGNVLGFNDLGAYVDEWRQW